MSEEAKEASEALTRAGINIGKAGPSRVVMETKTPTLKQVADILDQAKSEIGARADTHDAPDGEESMPLVVKMFNTLYGKDITAEQGWMFMVILKQVRAGQGGFKLDNYVDMAAYSAFAGKASRDERT